MKSQVESAAKAAGLDSTEITELHSQLQEAMETSKSEGLTREESIAAFDSILEENGIDVESFKSGIESLMQSTGQAPPPPPPSSTNEDEDDDESSFNITAEEFVDMMSNLPSGSLINAVA